MTPQEKTARNFYEWAVKNEWLDTEYEEDTIEEMIKDFKILYEKTPRMYYLLREISDK